MTSGSTLGGAISCRRYEQPTRPTTSFKTNADGSFDMYFGPTAPAGQESNWIETVPGRGFYPMFRLYSPTEGLFDGTWVLPDVELT